jgi:hypothetical protein
MAAETMMFKLSGAAQAAQVPTLAGHSFTVGNTVAAGDGVANWLFLNPVSGGGADRMVALKLEGARQSGQLSGLVGKTVTVGKAPLGASQAGKWLILHPGMGGMVGKGAAGGGGLAMQQMAFKTGENEMETASAKAAAGGGKGAGAKGAMGGKCALGGKGGAMGLGAGKGMGPGAGLGMGPGAGLGMGGKGGAACLNTANTAGQGAGMAVGAKSVAGGAKALTTGGTIWTGSGSSLGLGLGLGAWGPILLVGAVAAVGVGIYSYMKRPVEEGELEEAIS